MAVEVSEKECEALRALSKADLTCKKAKELIKERAADHLSNWLEPEKVVT